MWVPGNTLFSANSKRIAGLALKHRLPLGTSMGGGVRNGALVGHEIDDAYSARRAAEYVDQILRGAKPADMPFEQTRWKTIVNLKTARALGLTIPQAMLARADQVIE